MTQNNITILNEYIDYLTILKVDITQVNNTIKSSEDINKYKKECKLNLNKLQTLSKETKLYEKDYDDFRIAMGKFAVGINKLNLNEKESFTKEFINLSEEFEDLMQRNLLKDAYIWL